MMDIPFFYIQNYQTTQQVIALDKPTAKHIVQVLRKKTGDIIHLTDGKGHLLTCEITTADKKDCSVFIKDQQYCYLKKQRVSIAMSLLKNPNRFEWFVEKATEMGVADIIPLRCERTEKKSFRRDRIQGICISAMLQSQQCWLPQLHEPLQFDDFIKSKLEHTEKFIAHCLEDKNKQPLRLVTTEQSNTIIAIGPEGDFSPTEIQRANENDFIPVSLGDTRLRTETAGIKAAALLC
ncbi:MAG: RsmE family RNA methyltransferase [Chitinophagaceae bacterium]|nr:RsmE family RNA methyltransferase [Chitinophagaceae bacterium]HQV05296.1 RsmE family RNA methyltransferase [Chitinophagaceae bacterium]